MSDNTTNEPTVNDSNAISNATPRVASKKSVDKAIDIIRHRSRKKKLPLKRKSDFEEIQERVKNLSCLMSYTTASKKVNVTSAFSRTFVPTELTNALKDEDWKSLSQLFPMLLKCVYAEPFIWRYAFIIFLINPNSNQFEFEDFLRTSLGSEAKNCNALLEKLLSFSDKNEPDE